MFKDYRKYTVIPYEIEDYSTYASVYEPLNIKYNEPNDPNSRWSTTTNDHLQYVVLRTKPCILLTITFGKYNKMHVCNVKKMRISVSEDNVTYREAFYGGLKNDTEMETFNLKISNNGPYFITKYIKIEPLAAWGINFNYSIWFTQLRGVSKIENFYKLNDAINYKNSLKYCLRFLRENGYKNICGQLEKESGYQLDNSITRKIRELLDSNSYDDVEKIVEELDTSVFEDFIEKSPYIILWTEIPKQDVWPCERGGHQMVSMNNKLYLYGGWNGIEELDDLWEYTNKWCLINEKDLPGKRSCHRMMAYNKKLYVFGKYAPSGSTNLREKGIWVYDGHNWKNDDPTELGPENSYDHQMAVVDKKLYIFGGKSTEKEENYGGLHVYSLENDVSLCKEPSWLHNEEIKNLETFYQREFSGSTTEESHSEANGETRTDSQNIDNNIDPNNEIQISNFINTKRWCTIRTDYIQPPNTPSLKSRLGHSMLFIPPDYIKNSIYNNSLVIIGGQKGKDVVREMTFYNIETDTVFQNIPFPIKGDGRIVQRATLYEKSIILLFCYGREKEGKFEYLDVYSYSLTKHTWNQAVEKKDFLDIMNKPIPRSAHQMTELNGIFYLFGGNISEKNEKRTNDFWKFKLVKKNSQEIKHLAKFMVRKHHFLYLLDTNEEKAVEYLRTKVMELVITDETKELMEELCCEIYRRKVFNNAYDDICTLLNDDM